MRTAYDGFIDFWNDLLETGLTKRIIIIIISLIVAYFCWRMHVRATLKGRYHRGARGFWTVWLFLSWAGMWYAGWGAFNILYRYLKNIF